MTDKDYEQKKREYWLIYAGAFDIKDEIPNEAFNWVFDRAYALGKQEKDAEETKADVTMKARRKSDGRIIEIREWRGASDVIYSSPDMNQFYQASELDFNVDAENTVIQGWVCRDKEWDKDLFASDLYLSAEKPTRDEYCGAWCNMCAYMPLNTELFPDLTWESDPEQVEIILKRKKNG